MSYPFTKIEKYWRQRWEEEKIYEPNLDRAKKPFYNLMMFPYPSAEGLHVGNVYAFVGSDIYGRYKRMQGYDVFEPIGLDGFGIHSENYALKVGIHPVRQAKISEKNFYRQLKEIGNSFAWEERIETYKPDYYKWTQWLFIQMFKNGLAYRKRKSVNWCPSCKTVLADEQVIENKCERCSSRVKNKELEQWFFKITDYAEELVRGLDKLDWPLRIKTAQRNWIGRTEGVILAFPIKSYRLKVEVFTTRADTIFGATYIALAPENPLITEPELRIKNIKRVLAYIRRSRKVHRNLFETKSKNGIKLEGIKAINPATKKELPVWVADYVLGEVGTGAIMGVPAHDERDFEFAKYHNLPVRQVVISKEEYSSRQAKESKLKKAYIEEGILINSGKFSGIDSQKARQLIAKMLKGKKMVQYRLRDWTISRQRYWGPPIPMIYCANCAKKKKGERKDMPGWFTVSEKDLPIKLPYIKEFRPQGKGKSPLALIEKFYKTKCPCCGGLARRETDVSDTFLDSAWYYLRYLDPKNKKEFARKSRLKKWLPVALYTGGAEHAVLHLLYFRFIWKVLCDLNYLPFAKDNFYEPALRFRAHGLLIHEGAKMSKSKGNIINPDEFIKKFGADALRMHLMFLGPFEQGGDFRDKGILGPVRFLDRVWSLALKLKTKKESQNINPEILSFLHQTIKKVTLDIESLHYNTAISFLMTFLKEIEKTENKRVFVEFLKLLAPFITEEIWRNIFQKKGSIHTAGWPIYKDDLLKRDNFELLIQINGKLKAKVIAPLEISEAEAKKLALSLSKIKLLLKKRIKRIIFIKNRLINFVV